jgi:hypothetical protein
MSDTLVKFKILDSTGFSTHEKPADEALEYIRSYLQQKNGWFYLDKALSNIEHVTVEDLKAASIITITNVIIGGDAVLFPTVFEEVGNGLSWKPGA